MEDEGQSTQGSESQDSVEPAPPGSSFDKQGVKVIPALAKTVMPPASSPVLTGPRTTARGVENARKMLRAFSIQKKGPVGPVTVATPAKLATSAGTTVMIGKLTSVKPTVKPDKVPDAEKIPKPPKPGQLRKAALESYEEQQKKTLVEIEHMKRKLEMVDLGIPLGLLCPEHSEKAMPTKAMPPIKTFLAIEKVDEIIREAKKAKAEGRDFKFDYHKFVPDYTNPFQRKKDEDNQEKESQERRTDILYHARKRERKSSSRFDRRERDYRKDDASRYRDQERAKSRDSNSSRDRDEKYKERDSTEKDAKTKIKEEKSDTPRSTGKIQETKVNLNDYLVCDSWSLDNEDRNSISSPKVDEKQSKGTPKEQIVVSPLQQLRDSLKKSKSPADQLKELAKKEIKKDSPETKPLKFEKLQPVMDSFKFEIDEDEDEALDDQDMKPKTQKFNYRDGMDESFLESVINEMKQEEMSDNSQDKSLVEYDISPKKEVKTQGSITPELDDSFRDTQSQRSDYSDGWRSTESRKSVDSLKSSDTGYKSSETGYKTTDTGCKTSDNCYKTSESGRKSLQIDDKSNDSSKFSEIGNSRSSDSRRSKGSSKSRRESSVSVEKELDVARFEAEMPKSTVDSLEMWSFVLKICQPLLFRHDRNKCYKETRSTPKLWYTENPKVCNCVKDRSVVYEELEMCKCALVDRVYGCDQIAETPLATSRTWYPTEEQCLIEATHTPTELPSDEAKSTTDVAKSTTDVAKSTTDLAKSTADVAKSTADAAKSTTDVAKSTTDEAKSTAGPECGTNEWEDERETRTLTPEKTEEIILDREYQRFMEAVWPEVVDAQEKDKTPRSTTPERMERKNKITEEKDQKKGAKKIKLAEDWSQESEVDEELEKRKRRKKKNLEASDRDKSREKARKRKLSTSTFSSGSSDDDHKKKKKKVDKKKDAKKSKQKKVKDRRLEKKVLKKLKLKKKKKKEVSKEVTDFEEGLQKAAKETKAAETASNVGIQEPKKKEKKIKKKTTQKAKKKTEKKKKKKRSRSTSSSDSSSSSDSESESDRKEKVRKREEDRKKKKTKKKKKKHRSLDSESAQSDELFDVNVLNNIKTERVEPRPLPRPIINVNTLQDDFSSTVKIKQEVEEERPEQPIEEAAVEKETSVESKQEETVPEASEPVSEPVAEPVSLDYGTENFTANVDVASEKDYMPIPSEASEPYTQEQDSSVAPQPTYKHGTSDTYEAPYPKAGPGEYEQDQQDHYEMYEQMAMEYQSGVANQISESPARAESSTQRIETVVRCRVLGEIKCDWRCGAAPAPQGAHRPSRWGLKPGDVNIVLTGGSESAAASGPVYSIQSVATQRNDASGYDEAYEVMYGASDRLQYGHCFDVDTAQETRLSLDDRINTVLSEVAKATDDNVDKGDKSNNRNRVVKRVSFADGYKPGQDSDVEDPPVRKRKKPRRVGCAWPCPATHPDHVSLWDALPPPPPPPGSPPPPPARGPPAHLLRAQYPHEVMTQGNFGQQHPIMPQGKFDPSNPMLPTFMPPKPPPGLISFP